MRSAYCAGDVDSSGAAGPTRPASGDGDGDYPSTLEDEAVTLPLDPRPLVAPWPTRTLAAAAIRILTGVVLLYALAAWLGDPRMPPEAGAQEALGEARPTRYASRIDRHVDRQIDTESGRPAGRLR